MNILSLTTLTHPLKIDTLKFEHIYGFETLLPVFIKALLQKTRKKLFGIAAMKTDLSTLKAHAQGRWHHIHATLGIPTTYRAT